MTISLEGVEEVRPGEVVSATTFNALVRVLRELVDAIGGGGGAQQGAGGAGELGHVGLGAGAQSLVFSIAERVRWGGLGGPVWAAARITGVTVDPLVPNLPSDVLYSVKIVGSTAGLTNVAPTFGRPVKNDQAKIYAAQVGMPCMVLRWPGGPAAPYAGALALFEGSEIVYRQPCPDPEPPNVPLLSAEELMLPFEERRRLLEVRMTLKNAGVRGPLAVGGWGEGIKGSGDQGIGAGSGSGGGGGGGLGGPGGGGGASGGSGA